MVLLLFTFIVLAHEHCCFQTTKGHQGRRYDEGGGGRGGRRRSGGGRGAIETINTSGRVQNMFDKVLEA